MWPFKSKNEEDKNESKRIVIVDKPVKLSEQDLRFAIPPVKPYVKPRKDNKDDEPDLLTVMAIGASIANCIDLLQDNPSPDSEPSPSIEPGGGEFAGGGSSGDFGSGDSGGSDFGSSDSGGGDCGDCGGGGGD